MCQTLPKRVVLAPGDFAQCIDAVGHAVIRVVEEQRPVAHLVGRRDSTAAGVITVRDAVLDPDGVSVCLRLRAGQQRPALRRQLAGEPALHVETLIQVARLGGCRRPHRPHQMPEGVVGIAGESAIRRRFLHDPAQSVIAAKRGLVLGIQDHWRQVGEPRCRCHELRLHRRDSCCVAGALDQVAGGVVDVPGQVAFGVELAGLAPARIVKVRGVLVIRD